MSQHSPFRTVLRGYEPTQVDDCIEGLTRTCGERAQAAAELERQVAVLERRLAAADSDARRAVDLAVERALANPSDQGAGRVPRQAGPELGDDGDSSGSRLQRGAPARPPHSGNAYVDLGVRIGQVLALASEEAIELVSRAEADAEATRREAQAGARLVRAEADRYDTTVRSDAQAEAARLLADARREADDVLDAAERDARVRREEGEALWEQHRATAAQAAADFEVALATRREHAEAEYTGKLHAAQARLVALERAGAVARGRCDQEVAAAADEARRLLADARVRADAVVGEARARADRVRDDSERELTAASQRRDSVNAQLANVRQMLATLSGSAPVIGFEEHRTPDEHRTSDEHRTADEGEAMVVDLRTGVRLAEHRR